MPFLQSENSHVTKPIAIRRAESLFPTGIRSRTVHPVVSRYTDWATQPTRLWWYVAEIFLEWELFETKL